MSDEAAFLDSLKANPADDTARLVYADWLDEHGHPERAEYLRLVEALAHAETDHAREQPDVARTLALAESLPKDWRDSVGSRFRVVFYGCIEVAKKLSTVKAVRACARSLGEAMAIVESCGPSELVARVSFEQGLLTRDTVRGAGGTVHLHP